MNYKTLCRIGAYLAMAMLASFVGYIVAWYYEKVEGDFSLLLFLASVGTGLFWLAERYYFAKQRAAQPDIEEPQEALTTMLIKGLAGEAPVGRKMPWWIDWTAGLFPVIVIVFLLRSFLFEPFKIPSGSMYPTLEVSDLILVNKFHYGVRLPVANKKITDGTPVARGDVMVFRYPPKPSLNYIKRVVGLPGDTVTYVSKRLTINGKEIATTDLIDYFDEDAGEIRKQHVEDFDGKKHRILVNPRRAAGWSENDTEAKFLFKQNCDYSDLGVKCKVPEGHYFMMGDNRDNSMDSRFFGFVPDNHIVGKAVYVWMNTKVFPMSFEFSKFKRIGAFD